MISIHSTLTQEFDLMYTFIFICTDPFYPSPNLIRILPGRLLFADRWIMQKADRFDSRNIFAHYLIDAHKTIYQINIVKHTQALFSPGAKIGTWKSLIVQGFMTDSESLVHWRNLSLVATKTTLGHFFIIYTIANLHIISISKTEEMQLK